MFEFPWNKKRSEIAYLHLAQFGEREIVWENRKKRNILKMLQIVSCTMFKLSWIFWYSNPLIRFPVM